MFFTIILRKVGMFYSSSLSVIVSLTCSTNELRVNLIGYISFFGSFNWIMRGIVLASTKISIASTISCVISGFKKEGISCESKLTLFVVSLIHFGGVDANVNFDVDGLPILSIVDDVFFFTFSFIVRFRSAWALERLATNADWRALISPWEISGVCTSESAVANTVTTSRVGCNVAKAISVIETGASEALFGKDYLIIVDVGFTVVASDDIAISVYFRWLDHFGGWKGLW